MWSNTSFNIDELNEIDSESAEKIDPVIDRMAKNYISSINIEYKYLDNPRSPTSHLFQDGKTNDAQFPSSGEAASKKSGIPDLRHKTRIQNRFQCKKKLVGHIKQILDNEHCVSILEDEDGQKFIYDFRKEALPVHQRTRIEEGGLLIVLVGDQYEGTTLVNKTKVYLSPFSAVGKNRVGKKIIAEDLEKWGF